MKRKPFDAVKVMLSADAPVIDIETFDKSPALALAVTEIVPTVITALPEVVAEPEVTISVIASPLSLSISAVLSNALFSVTVVPISSRMTIWVSLSGIAEAALMLMPWLSPVVMF